MGLFSSLFGSSPKTSKARVGGLAASTLDYVLQNEGAATLAAGSLVLTKDFRVSFRGGKPQIGGDLVAVVPIGDLEEAAIFKTLGEIGGGAMPGSPMLIDMVVYAAMREFSVQYAPFDQLPTT